MRIKLARAVGGLVAVSALGAGCSGEGYDDGALLGDDEFATVQQPLCENKGGTNSVMTALAVAAGQYLRRWQPATDFAWNSSAGRLELSSTGAARCGGSSSTSCVDTWNPTDSTCEQQKSWGNCNASWMGTQCQATCGQCSGGSTSGGGCASIQAILDMQKPEAHGQVTFPGNIKLDVSLLKSKLQTAWNDQMSCNSSGACNVRAHTLKFTHSENGSCDKKFFFDPLQEGSTSWLNTTDATNLSRQLKFVGYPSNKMLNFYVRNGQVSVDPTYGLNEGATSSSGSCDAACTKISSTDISGRCCTCNGSTKKFVRSTFSPQVYLCK